ncbi:MAG: hypothetical protein ACOZBH_02300 [Patescibacteria group bacterium]
MEGPFALESVSERGGVEEEFGNERSFAIRGNDTPQTAEHADILLSHEFLVKLKDQNSEESRRDQKKHVILLIGCLAAPVGVEPTLIPDDRLTGRTTRPFYVGRCRNYEFTNLYKCYEWLRINLFGQYVTICNICTDM